MASSSSGIQRAAFPAVRAQGNGTPQVFGALVANLVEREWDPRRAASRAPSLARALKALERLRAFRP